MVDEDFPVIQFTAESRCDRCGAQAYTLATHEEFTELMFCLHHRKEHFDSLLDKGWTVIDDNEAIERLVPAYPTPV